MNGERNVGNPRRWGFVFILGLCGSAAQAQSGACCWAGGCSVLPPTVCATRPCFVYQGDNTTCAAGCPAAPLGACCFIDGGCEISTECECALGPPFSAWMGAGTTCSSCTLGACCWFTGSTPACTHM